MMIDRWRREHKQSINERIPLLRLVQLNHRKSISTHSSSHVQPNNKQSSVGTHTRTHIDVVEIFLSRSIDKANTRCFFITLREAKRTEGKWTSRLCPRRSLSPLITWWVRSSRSPPSALLTWSSFSSSKWHEKVTSWPTSAFKIWWWGDESLTCNVPSMETRKRMTNIGLAEHFAHDHDDDDDDDGMTDDRMNVKRIKQHGERERRERKRERGGGKEREVFLLSSQLS